VLTRQCHVCSNLGKWDAGIMRFRLSPPGASQRRKSAVGASRSLARSRRERDALMLRTGYANPLGFFWQI
jgi:hypothetical protein